MLKYPNYKITENQDVHVILVVNRNLENQARDLVNGYYAKFVAGKINESSTIFNLGRVEGKSLSVVRHNGDPIDHFDAVKNFVEASTDQLYNPFLIDFHYPKKARQSEEEEYKLIKNFLGEYGIPSQVRHTAVFYF